MDPQRQKSKRQAFINNPTTLPHRYNAHTQKAHGTLINFLIKKPAFLNKNSKEALIPTKALKKQLVVFVSLFTLAALIIFLINTFELFPFSSNLPKINKNTLKQALASESLLSGFPETIKVNAGKKTRTLNLDYTFEKIFENKIAKIFNSYKPDFGVFAAIDPKTGKILALVSYSNQEISDHLALKANFPSASVFKMVTAATAIEVGHMSPENLIPYNGRSHTLYRFQVLNNKYNKWTRYLTLKQAFARSVNPIFAKLGVFFLKPTDLMKYAKRFGFNQNPTLDLPVEQGRAWIPEEIWGRAESASGFTPKNTMSPLQGAWMASAIANNGVLMEPYAVERVRTDKTDQIVYEANPKISREILTPKTNNNIKKLMAETIHKGTSRSSFKDFFKGNYKDFDVGGKTGSLDGQNPKGRYDWFVGYANQDDKSIAFAVLTIHKKYWRVKSAVIANKAIKEYFDPYFKNQNIAKFVK